MKSYAELTCYEEMRRLLIWEQTDCKVQKYWHFPEWKTQDKKLTVFLY